VHKTNCVCVTESSHLILFKQIICACSDNHILSLSLWLESPSDLGHFFSFLIIYAVGRTPCPGGSRSRKGAAYTQNKRTQIFMPSVGFELTIPAFESGQFDRPDNHIEHTNILREPTVEFLTAKAGGT
jgi:hypothetical protein